MSPNFLRKIWKACAAFPGGRWLFSRMLGRFVPYTGSIGAQVLELSPGYSRVRLRDRKKIRNHLNCIHALALANLGEMASGLAFIMGLPEGARSIVVSLKIDFLAKARGTLIAEGKAEVPAEVRERDIEVKAFIRNSSNQLVAEVTVLWKMSANPKA